LHHDVLAQTLYPPRSPAGEGVRKGYAHSVMAGLLLMVTMTAFVGCGQAPPPPPSAVITVTPEAVLQGQPVRLAFDAGKSTPRLTLVPAAANPDDGQLEYSWEFSGGVTGVPADLTAVEIAVTATGDRPVHATLTVRNRWGGQVSALHSVPLVAPDAN
jgi:hypothetical protein